MIIFSGAEVVEPHQVTKCDVAIDGQKIIAIAPHIEDVNATRIDVSGKIILPGVVDAHVHLNEPGNEEWEGFKRGSTMLAAGGVTTFFDMPLNSNPPTINVSALELKKQLAEQKSNIDYRFWGGLVPTNIPLLQSLADNGVIGFKAFLSNSGFQPFSSVDDQALLQGMFEIAKLGKILALHAESDTITSCLAQQKLEKGTVTAKDYCESRPIVAEVDAVQRALHYAEITGCALHFVHISTPQAVEIIHEYKQKGLDVTLETCPHYLLFNDTAFDSHQVYAKCAPPLRSESIRKELIVKLLEGKIDYIASDHSPCPKELKELTPPNYFKSWGGINGGQFTLLSILQIAEEYQLPLTDVARWTAQAPAQRFELGGKGEIAVGMDADFVIVEKNPFKVDEKMIYAKHKGTIYKDFNFDYQIISTYSRGKEVFQSKNSQVVGG